MYGTEKSVNIILYPGGNIIKVMTMYISIVAKSGGLRRVNFSQV